MPATTSGRFVGRFMGRTFLVGLENNIPNSFLNGIVFLFWCISGLKERIMSHICDDPLCVACELRFLFRMFDQGLATQKEVSTGASSHHHFTSHHHLITSHHIITSSLHTTHLQQGIVVHATNFYRVLAHRTDTIAFGILDAPDAIPSLYRTLPHLTHRRAERFIHYALNQMVGEAPCVLPVVGVSTLQTNTCSLGHTNTKTNTTLLLSLSWYGRFTPIIHQVVLTTALRCSRGAIHRHVLVLLAVVRVVPKGGRVSCVEAGAVPSFVSHPDGRSAGQRG